MKKTRLLKALSLILCIVLIAAMALSTTGCDDNKVNPTAAPTASATEAPESEVTELGKGSKKFDFTVTDGEGKETKFIINTEKTTVGEALLELELIAGEDGAYGLYVKTVNGITVDYDKDGKYWAFYVDGEYAMSGVDTTEIEEGKVYSFKVE
ncbi:MAG: DUF4430 domain-containing protein [Ruminococcaceae bacterium]|nr:DUF4430 domain-containing protein [Oscillospiraceae bacterium]